MKYTYEDLINVETLEAYKVVRADLDLKDECLEGISHIDFELDEGSEVTGCVVFEYYN
jgi:hypothetical protein